LHGFGAKASRIGAKRQFGASFQDIAPRTLRGVRFDRGRTRTAKPSSQQARGWPQRCGQPFAFLAPYTTPAMHHFRADHRPGSACSSV
jgi:hypothetical protein